MQHSSNNFNRTRCLVIHVPCVVYPLFTHNSYVYKVIFTLNILRYDMLKDPKEEYIKYPASYRSLTYISSCTCNVNWRRMYSITVTVFEQGIKVITHKTHKVISIHTTVIPFPQIIFHKG